MDAVARDTVYRSAASLTVGLVGVFWQSAQQANWPALGSVITAHSFAMAILN